MDTLQLVERGRVSYEQRAWSDAYESLSRAEGKQPLDAEDLERLAMSAYLSGRDAASTDGWARAHQEFLRRGAVERAVRCAMWLAFGLLQKGERARASGWIARGQRLLDDGKIDCVEQGYLLLPTGLRQVAEGNAAGAYEFFCRAAELGARFGDPDLLALSLHCRGRVLLRQGRIDEGVALLDEAMAAVEAGEVSPIVVGDVYCSVIEGCLEILDLRRAQEWTGVLTQWCESQPDMVPYRGQCMVRRAELMQLHGEWAGALNEAQRACEWLTRPPGERAAGAAFYQHAELLRLRGQFADAEHAYREASRWGKKPQPGLAQLRLAQRQVDAAAAGLRQELDATRDPHRRARLLATYVDVMLAAEDVAAARHAAEELAEIAAVREVPLLRALASRSAGVVLLAEGEAGAALSSLRQSWATWQEIDAPYEGARVRVLLGLASRSIGDADAADMELNAARAVFQALGAKPDLDRVDQLTQPRASTTAGGLTPRELQVLRLVASGRTNRAIAAELSISEKTVARHISNIFTKLGLSSRAAATAFAYEHELV